MPEGHTIHRYARLHRRALAGRRLAVSSPQGRFAGGAAVLDGHELDDVDALGKHLFYRFAPATLHVHLGLFGRFRRFASATAPPPTAGTRLQMVSGDVMIRLAGPTACDLIDDEAERLLRTRIGPDPLRRDFDATEVAVRMARRRAAIGQVLLDQSVISGVGNVYRAEALFTCGIHPDVPARDLGTDDVAALCATVVAMLRAGERAGRIVTVEPADVGVTARRDVPSAERVYVYKRAGLPCRRCTTTIVSWELGARTVFACPRCQPRR